MGIEWTEIGELEGALRSAAAELRSSLSVRSEAWLRIIGERNDAITDLSGRLMIERASRNEAEAERDAAVARAEAAEAALAAARAEGAAAERAKAAATLRFRAKVMRERKAFGIAEEVDALAFYIEQRGVAAQAKVGCTCADIDPRQRPCAHCDL